MKNRLQKIISETIKKMLAEESEQETSGADSTKKDTIQTGQPKILTKGAFGSGGRSKAFVADAKARAESDPRGLMKDLGITAASTGNDLEKVLRILNGAIHSNSLMSQGYMGAALREDEIPGKKDKRPVVTIKMNALDRKNGIRFLAHTLTAAQNAGLLDLKRSVQFAQGSSYPVIIHTT
jgi:hypothetical protein